MKGTTGSERSAVVLLDVVVVGGVVMGQQGRYAAVRGAPSVERLPATGLKHGENHRT